MVFSGDLLKNMLVNFRVEYLLILQKYLKYLDKYQDKYLAFKYK